MCVRVGKLHHRDRNKLVKVALREREKLKDRSDYLRQELKAARTVDEECSRLVGEKAVKGAKEKKEDLALEAVIGGVLQELESRNASLAPLEELRDHVSKLVNSKTDEVCSALRPMDGVSMRRHLALVTSINNTQAGRRADSKGFSKFLTGLGMEPVPHKNRCLTI